MLENRRKKYLKDLPTSALVPGDNGLIACKLACRNIIALRTEFKNGIRRGYFSLGFDRHLRTKKHQRNEEAWIKAGKPFVPPVESYPSEDLEGQSSG
jgi:hypothetical protein